MIGSKKNLSTICVVVWALLATTSGTLQAQNPASEIRVPLGMNFNFSNAGQKTERECGSSNPRPPQERLASRLLHYGSPEMRARSLADLKELRRRDVTWIRSLVWFAAAANVPLSFDAQFDGRQAGANLSALGADLWNLGFKSWIIAFGPQGRASPTCFSNSRFGQCYDSSTLQHTIDFITTARASLENVRHPPLWIDLSNEACPGRSLQNNQEAIENEHSYLTAILRTYLKRFPNDRLTVSCIGDRQLDVRLQNIRKIFAEAGANPTFLDAHIYSKPGVSTSETSTILKEFSLRLGVPAIIGETNLNRPDVQSEILKSWANSRSRLLAMIFWPLQDSERVCGADVPEIPR